jgi:hypothetical protein
LEKWELMQQISKRLTQFDPDNVQWTISLAYATRRAYSVDTAMEILLNAEAFDAMEMQNLRICEAFHPLSSNGGDRKMSEMLDRFV